MDTLKWMLGMAPPAREQPARVPTDEVYPVHYCDDTPQNRKINMTWMLRFEDVLDVDVLSESLTRLLSRDGWKKLGGRVRFAPDNKLEIHVPSKFTSERPAFRLSQRTYDMPLNEHPLARTLPKHAEHPFTQPLNNIYREFEAREDVPMSTTDLCYCDEPQMSLHITSFQDETLVALSWPHILTSALGRQALMKAWSLVMAGRDDEVPPMSSAMDDPMEKLGRLDTPPSEQEPFVLEQQNKRLHGLSFFKLALSTVWEMYWRPYMDVRIMFLPADFIARLRKTALQDLQSDQKGPVDASAPPPFVSEGDVISAWTSRILSRSRQHCPIQAVTVVDIQGRFREAFTPGHAYVQNTILAVFTLFGRGEARTATLGQQAHKVRETIVEQTTERQCEAFLRLGRQLNHRPIFGEPDSTFLIVTNWTKAKFAEIIDFSPAVARRGVPEGQRRTEPGRVVYHHPNILAPSVTFRDCLQVMGKDKEGNYWFKGAFLPEFWELFEQELRVKA